jgi:hypothetical protein
LAEIDRMISAGVRFGCQFAWNCDPTFAPNSGSDSDSMKFSGGLVVLQLGNHRHVDWNFISCTERVGSRERK